MKKLFFTLSFLPFSFLSFAQERENDSIIKKEHKFLFGITIAPNYSWREYHDDSSFGTIFFGEPKDESPGWGYSIMLNEKITHKRFMFNIGSGIGFYNYKGHYQYDITYPPAYTMVVDYKYKHMIMEICTDYNLLLGKDKSWNLGVLAEISSVFRLTQDVKIQRYEASSSEPQGEYNYLLNFSDSGPFFWGGVTAGKSIRATKWLIMNFSLNCKFSSKIKTSHTLFNYSYTAKAQPRNLMALSLNISFYPIFKQK